MVFPAAGFHFVKALVQIEAREHDWRLLTSPFGGADLILHARDKPPIVVGLKANGLISC